MPTYSPDGVHIVDQQTGDVVGYVEDQQPAQRGVILAKPVDPYRAEDQQMQRDAANRSASAADRANVNAARAADLAQQKMDADLYRDGLRMGPNGMPEPIPGFVNPKTLQEGQEKKGAYTSVINQVNRLYELYNEGVGQTSGVSALMDYLPTDANSAFTTAGAGLGDQGMAAFKVPGMGAQSDADAQRFVDANQPSQYDKDVQSLEKLRQIRQRLESNMSAAGLPAPQFNFGLDGKPIAPQLSPQARGGGFATGGGPISNSPTSANLPPAEMIAELRGYAAARQGQDVDAQDFSAFYTGLAKRYNFPDATPESLENYRKAIKTNSFGGIDPQKQNKSTLGQIQANFSASPLGALSTSVANGLTSGFSDEIKAGVQTGFGTLGNYKSALDQANQQKSQAQDAHPVISLGGNIAGGIASSLGGGAALGKLGGLAAMYAKNPVALGMAGNVAFGGLQGAGENNADRFSGALNGAAMALGGDALFRGGGNIIGGLAKGVNAPAARRLAEQGVEMTGGQIMRERGGALGRMVSGAEDAATSLPGVGDMILANRDNSIEGLNRAAFRIAAQPVNRNVKDIGSTGLAQLDQMRGDSYDAALRPMSLKVDDDFIDQFPDPRINKFNLDPEMQRKFGTTMNNAARLIGQNGNISGPNLQAMKQILRGESAAYKNVPGGQFMRSALGEADDAVMGMAARQQPELFGKYRDADKLNGRFKTIQSAANAASGKAGNPFVFGGSQLATALKGKKVTQDTANAFGQLSEDAVAVLPSQLSDSGTARRLIGSMALGSGVGAGAFATGMSAPGIALAALTAAANTKKGRAAIQSILIGKRSPGMIGSAKAINKNTARAAQIGSAIAPNLGGY